jgi:hypothetical protein
MPATRCCCLVTLIDHLVRNAVEADRARIAEEEAEQWRTCFGPAAPPDQASRARRIIQIASARAVLAMNATPSSEGGE